jgi:hypothetical protein
MKPERVQDARVASALGELEDLHVELSDVNLLLGELHDALPAEGLLARIRDEVAAVRGEHLADAVDRLEAVQHLDEAAAAHRRRENAQRLDQLTAGENAEVRARLRGAVTGLDMGLAELRKSLTLLLRARRPVAPHKPKPPPMLEPLPECILVSRGQRRLFSSLGGAA